MRIVVIANQKGGVGKSYVSVGLAGAWAEAGHRPIIIDANDPQHTSASWLGGADVGVEVVRCGEADERIGHLLLELRRRNQHDVAIVDTPPRAVAALAAAAEVADTLLAPVTMAVGDIIPVAEMLRMDIKFPTDTRIVMNCVHTSKTFMREMREVIGAIGVPVCKATLGNRIVAARAQLRRLPVTIYEPAGKAACEMRALAREVWQ